VIAAQKAAWNLSDGFIFSPAMRARLPATYGLQHRRTLADRIVNLLVSAPECSIALSQQPWIGLARSA
jgi:hypothetical protein